MAFLLAHRAWSQWDCGIAPLSPPLVERPGAGSDYPRGEIETDPVGVVSKAGLPAAERNRILSGNAQALFGIRMPAAPARGTR